MTLKHVPGVYGVTEGMPCAQSHYVAIVEAQRLAVEVYQLGDIDCPNCCRRMADKHAALAEVFRTRLAALPPTRCRIYDSPCLNPTYCDARDACCAGDPECKEPAS